MHAALCLLHVGQQRSTGDAAKLSQFIGQFSWVTGDPTGLRGLTDVSDHLLNWVIINKSRNKTSKLKHAKFERPFIIIIIIHINVLL